MSGDLEAPGTDWSRGLDHVRPEEVRVGVVFDADPVSFQLLRGEPLLRYAAVALDEADIAPVPASGVLGAEPTGMTVIFHDAACPLLDPATIVRLADLAEDTGQVVVGVRPVTDTVKRLADGPGDYLGETVDRDALQALAAPVVVPAACSDRLAEIDRRVASIPELVAALGFAEKNAPGPAEKEASGFGALRTELVPAGARRVTADQLPLLAT